MFGRWLKPAQEVPTSLAATEVLREVREHLPNADDESVRAVAAIASLFAAVAYADRDYSDVEEAHVREALGRVHGLGEAGIEAICAALRRHVRELSTVELPRSARALLEIGDEELRREVLEGLVDLAAADDELSTAETNLLRQVTTSLGLSQSVYVDAQARHRERLSVLGKRR